MWYICFIKMDTERIELSLPRRIELLAPAATLDGGLAALSAGADAVYVGAPKYGARSAAAVSLEDIHTLCEEAHIYGASVYVALNTILTDEQLPDAVELVHQLYSAGADALIIQDLGLLLQDLPPIPLHASTQCHNNSLEQLRLLSDLGLEQAVLPREWSVEDIAQVRDLVPLRLEAFIHGALCVSYSGRCFISEALSGRSANRGQCAQYCRMTYDLTDAEGQLLRKGQHLLSLRDLNRSELLEQMIDAGVSSFKIEGRLKGVPYVRNVTAHYRQLLDAILSRRCGELMRFSWGETQYRFTPRPAATFSRPFTDYNTPLGQPIPEESITPRSSKSLGEAIGTLVRGRGKEIEIHLTMPSTILANGDGIVGFSADGRLCGAQVNQVTPARKDPSHLLLRLSQPLQLPAGGTIWRNLDHELEKTLLRPDATERTIPLEMSLSATPISVSLTLKSSEVSVTLTEEVALEPARRDITEPLRRTLAKLGGTPYYAAEIHLDLGGLFVPLSLTTELRRQAVDRLVERQRAVALAKRDVRGAEQLAHRRETLARLTGEDAETTRSRYGLPADLDFTYNVANDSARHLYRRLGVTGEISPALEVVRPVGPIPVMFTRHCLLHQLGYCTRTHSKPPFPLPLYLVRGSQRIRIETDCRRCGMILWLDQG